MGRFILRRILLLIPTVLLVLVFAFILQSLSSNDSIDQLLSGEGESSLASHTNYLESYKKLARTRGKDLSIFYYSIVPAYTPANIQEIIPLSTRKDFLHIAKQCQSSNELLRIYKTIDELIEIAEIANATEQRSALLQLRSSKTLSDLKKRSNAILINKNTFNEKVVDLNSQIQQLQLSTAWILPSFRWNGFNNQFHKFIKGGIFTSKSLLDGSLVINKITAALRWTITLSLLSLIGIAILTLVISYFQIIGEGQLWERISSGLFYMIYAMPLFWIATIMVVFFTTSEYGEWTDWFPSVGIRIRPGQDLGPWQQIFQNIDRLILPIICLLINALAFTTKQTKSEIQQQFKKPYVLAAKAKGLSFRQLLLKHVFPNSLVTYTTIMTGRIASLFSGSIIIEYIFNIPGIGRLLFNSMYESDWPVIFGILILIAVATILAYLLGDILLAAINPRMRQKLAAA